VQTFSFNPLARTFGKGFSLTRFAQGLCVGLVLCSGVAYTQKDRYAHRLADLSRSLIGDENTARVESWYFSVQDRIDQLSYDIFGGSTNPFSDDEPVATYRAGDTGDLLTGPLNTGLMAEGAVAPPAVPAPLVLPHTTLLQEGPAEGEGVWSTAGLPRSSLDDMLMAKTFIRPDSARPYAVVGILLVDHRRGRLHVTGGTDSPGGDLGVRGPGVIPEADRESLLAAWNGGFRGPHGGFGMYADGQQYRPLRDGFASLAVMQDGSIAMGTWGSDLTWSDDIVAVRQNAIMLVEHCEVSPRTNEGNDTWGYVDVNTSEFITWRSAIGLTANGDIMVAAGNSLSADSLARAMHAAGACSAMQLDINSPYVLTSLYFPQPDGAINSSRFMETMPDNPARFLGEQANDFMYLTLDESGFGS